jgi:galactose mutarotase-like enzyme
MGILLRNSGCRMRRYLMAGLKTVMLENRYLRITVLESKGADIVELLYKPLDIDILFKTPWGIESPASYTPSSTNPPGSFLDYYEGGWQTIFPVGGGPDTINGGYVGRHGELHTIPWELTVLKDAPDEVAIQLAVQTRRLPFLITKTITLREDSKSLQIVERIKNLSSVSFECMWGNHPAFGEPFLDDSVELTTSFQKAVIVNEALPEASNLKAGVYDWPLLKTKSGGIVDFTPIQNAGKDAANQIFLTSAAADKVWCALTNHNLKFGFKMIWDSDVFGSAWIWQENNATSKYPWYKRAKVLAVEPFSSYPAGIENARRQGNLVVFKPEELKEEQIQVEFFTL